MDMIWPFIICGLFGVLLAVMELIRTFGKWIGRYWTNRYVLSLIGLNAVTAMGVFAFMRYVLGVQSDVWLAIVTGITFPTILRSRFTFYRPLGKSKATIDVDGFSLTVDGWYRNLQNLCYEEVNTQIASERSKLLTRLRRCLTDKKMIELLRDHIAVEPMVEKKAEHASLLKTISELTDDEERHRQLAALMMDIMLESAIKQLLRGCDK